MTGCRKRCTKKSAAAAAGWAWPPHTWESASSSHDLVWTHNWPFQDLSDLQLALKKLVHIFFVWVWTYCYLLLVTVPFFFAIFVPIWRNFSFWLYPHIFWIDFSRWLNWVFWKMSPQKRRFDVWGLSFHLDQKKTCTYQVSSLFNFCKGSSMFLQGWQWWNMYRQLLLPVFLGTFQSKQISKKMFAPQPKCGVLRMCLTVDVASTIMRDALTNCLGEG